MLKEQLIKILGGVDDIEVSFSVSSGEEALKKIPAMAPDVILLDINLPGKSGIECIRDLKKFCPNTEIIMLTAYEEEDNIFNALREGASGYLLKTCPRRTLRGHPQRLHRRSTLLQPHRP